MERPGRNVKRNGEYLREEENGTEARENMGRETEKEREEMEREDGEWRGGKTGGLITRLMRSGIRDRGGGGGGRCR